MFARQLKLEPGPIGQTWTIRLRPEDGRRLDAFLRIVTAGGSVILVPIRAAGDIVFTAGADGGETRFDICFSPELPDTDSQLN